MAFEDLETPVEAGRLREERAGDIPELGPQRFDVGPQVRDLLVYAGELAADVRAACAKRETAR